MEHGAYFGNVVQREHKLAANLPQLLRKLLKVGFIEVVAVKFPTPVRRVEIEECRGPVVALEDFIIRSAFDLYPFQSLMSIFNELGKAFQVESRRLDHVAVIDRMPDEARKAVLQEIQVPRGPLDVRQDCRIGRAEKIET